MEFKLMILEKVTSWLVGGGLFDFIKNEVEIINDTTMTGEEKRKMVQDEAKKFFGDTTMFLINLAIEVAVVILNEKAGEVKDG